MASITPARPSRRAAARRNVIVETSDEDASPPRHDTQDSEDEFTPAAQKSPRRAPRRKTADVPLTPRQPRGKRAKTGDGLTPTQIFEPEATPGPSEVGSPTKKASPRKRKTVTAVSRKSRASVVPSIPPAMPTPEPSASPEMRAAELTPQTREITPLGDITSATTNSRVLAAAEPKSPTPKKMTLVKPMGTIMEKPMDIVLKSRSMAPPAVEEPAGPKARMVITYLVLNNFKSYAGRQVVGPFHASFSSVVGPNGSGKSNVIDSLLFVFGFRASKMRQGKISALIHNSARFSDLAFCEVEVHFQEILDLPGGGHEVIPDSNLIISRKAFKNNSSDYFMNGKKTNFTTVTNLLKDRGIDLDHKRFLILQGEVESIAQMKPKAANEHDDGLLEYLEDIIGTSKYKTPIEESAAEVETLNEVCVEKNGRVQHVEKEKSALEGKKNKALAYLRDENELAEKQSALYQVYIDECSDNLAVTEEAILDMQTQLNNEAHKHQGSEDGIKDLQKRYKQGAKEFENMEKETQIMVKEMAKYDKETVKFEEKRKFLTGKQKKMEKAMNTSRHAASESKSQVTKYTDDVERCTAEIAQLEKELMIEDKELSSVRDSLKGKTQGWSDQIALKQKSLEPWNEKINENQSAVAVAQSELDILREKGNAGVVALEELNTKITDIASRRTAKQTELEEYQIQKAKTVKQTKKLEAELEKTLQKEPELRSQLSAARQKADEARSSLASSQNQGNVLTGLMRLKDSGRIDGFHGRLGNLGAIDQKYDVAISTACPSLENLVVDSVEVGQQCIDYLRKNNLGRANFILLDRLARRDLSQIQTPENVPRLFDLVKPKDVKFSPAFFSVMQNTLVAENLEQANRIAYGARRWRVVTLDGQLIDVSGTMSGGGTRVARGGMSSKIVADTSKEQVAKLDVDRNEMEQKFQQHQEQLRELEQAVKASQEEIPKIDTQMQKLSLEIESYERNLADAQRRVKEIDAEQHPSKDDDKRVTVLEKQIDMIEKEINRLRSETAEVEQEIQALQDKIMETGGIKLRALKAKVDSLRDQINGLTEESSNAEVSKTKAEKQQAKHEKSRSDSEEELGNVAEELERLEDDIKNQSRDAASSRARVEEAQDALEVKKEELATLKAELDEKTAELNATRAIEIEMRNKLEENQKALAENQKRSRYWQDKLSKLTLQNVDDFGEEKEPPELPTYTKDELADMSKDRLKADIVQLEEKTQNAGADVSVLQEYRRRVQEHSARSADLATAVSSRDTAKQRCDQLRHLRLTGFMEGFSTISLRLKEMYQMITMGGNAELELVDSLDPFSEGILFSVMPPKKSWKNISNLSGGEKTLSSLALVFALHHYRPTPLYVMDEIDAALDFRNVSIYDLLSFCKRCLEALHFDRD